jgi:hypothetical protein
MRRVLWPSLLGLVVLAALAIGVGTSAAGDGRRAAALPTVSCQYATGRIAPEAAPAGGNRVVFGVVALPPAYLPPPVVRYQHDGWKYWYKAGLFVEAGNPAVRVSVPKAWRKRVAIGWGGTGPYSALRFDACAPPPTFWNAYAGGFSLNEASACVPLVISVGGQSRTVRFGIGRHCR